MKLLLHSIYQFAGGKRNVQLMSDRIHATSSSTQLYAQTQNRRASVIFSKARFFDTFVRPPRATQSAPPGSACSVNYGRVTDDAE